MFLCAIHSCIILHMTFCAFLTELGLLLVLVRQLNFQILKDSNHSFKFS